MLVCRKSSKVDSAARQEGAGPRRGGVRRRLGEGGPIFLPRRKTSALAEALLATSERVTAYDDLWFAGRPSN